MKDQILDCPACGEVKFRLSFTKKGRDFWTCLECGLQRQHPLPTLDQLVEYYNTEYAGGMYKTFAAATEMKDMTAKRRITEIRPYSRPGRWLDIGCSDGAFVRNARELPGVEARGVELSEVAVKLARGAGLDVTCGSIESMPIEARFDCITAFDVFEHVLNPRQFLSEIEKRLGPGGRVFISVPNTSSLIRKAMGPRWYFYIPEEHLHYYSANNLRMLIDHAALRTLAIRRTLKPLTYAYSMAQFAEYNPIIFRLMKSASYAIPEALQQKIIPLPIGELMVVAEKT